MFFFIMFYRVCWTNILFQKPVIQKARCSTWKWKAITTDISQRLPPEKHVTVSAYFPNISGAILAVNEWGFLLQLQSFAKF